MIDAVMYGMMPSANTVSWSRAPPEKTLMRLNNPEVLLSTDVAKSMHFCTFVTLTPGAGVIDPSRNNTMMPKAKRIFLRKSGVVKAFAKTRNTGFLLSR